MTAPPLSSLSQFIITVVFRHSFPLQTPRGRKSGQSNSVARAQITSHDTLHEDTETGKGASWAQRQSRPLVALVPASNRKPAWPATNSAVAAIPAELPTREVPLLTTIAALNCRSAPTTHASPLAFKSFSNASLQADNPSQGNICTIFEGTGRIPIKVIKPAQLPTLIQVPRRSSDELVTAIAPMWGCADHLYKCAIASSSRPSSEAGSNVSDGSPLRRRRSTSPSPGRGPLCMLTTMVPCIGCSA